MAKKHLYLSVLFFFSANIFAASKRILDVYPVHLETTYNETPGTNTANSGLTISLRNLSDVPQPITIVIRKEKIGVAGCAPLGTFSLNWTSAPAAPTCFASFYEPTTEYTRVLAPLKSHESRIESLNLNCEVRLNGGLKNCTRNGSANPASEALMPRLVIHYDFTLTVEVGEDRGAISGSLSSHPSTGFSVMPGQADYFPLNGGRPF